QGRPSRRERSAFVFWISFVVVAPAFVLRGFFGPLGFLAWWAALLAVDYLRNRRWREIRRLPAAWRILPSYLPNPVPVMFGVLMVLALFTAGSGKTTDLVMAGLTVVIALAGMASYTIRLAKRSDAKKPADPPGK